MTTRERYWSAARDYLSGASPAEIRAATQEAQRAADLAAMEYLRQLGLRKQARVVTMPRG